MKAFIDVVLLIVNAISFAIAVLFSIFGLYAEIMGFGAAEKLLQKIHVSLNYSQLWIIGILNIALGIFSCYLRKKLSGKPQKFLDE